ncbi:MAG: glycosyltransferase, partial [Proteobacteria bacterium]|nr:glycosyltransferase [Pseudomonadota bacterium]
GMKPKLALLYGNLPTVEEIDQFQLLRDLYDVYVIAAESIVDYLSKTSHFNDLKCLALPDHDENPTYLPGLERSLAGFDVVVVKERLGLYAFQAVKAKWRSNFRLVVWVDNLVPFPGEDLDQFRIIRSELADAADAFLVQSDAARQALILEGVNEKRITFFEPWVGIKVKRSQKMRSKALHVLNLKDSDFVIAHLGQVEWEEDLQLLLHASRKAMNDNVSLKRRLKIVICGVGSYSDELNLRAKQLGLDGRVIFVAPGRDAFETILMGADALFCSNTSNRDRLEGDPYRLLTAMAHKIPIIASRSPIVEEYVGKHRVDFCPGSVESLAGALVKASEAKSLVNNIAAKNASTFEQRFNTERVTRRMTQAFNDVLNVETRQDFNAIDRRVVEIEARIAEKQYLDAVELIEGLFAIQKVPVYHQANLYRLIGDCFVKLGDGNSGKAAYLKALDLDPYSAKAQIGLGTIALTRSSYDVAVIHFQRAVSFGLNDEMANLGLGLSFEGLGELHEANKWVVASLKINPMNSAAIFTSVKIAYARELFEDAREALCNYIARNPQDTNMLFSLAGIEFSSGNLVQAEQIGRQMAAIDPQDTRVQQFLAKVSSANSDAQASGSKGR